MRLRLQGTEASLRTFIVPIFKPLVDFELECFALPPSLLQSPVLEITPDIKFFATLRRICSPTARASSAAIVT